MYEFTKTNELAGWPTPSLSTVFHDINLDDALTDGTGGFKTLTVTGRGNMEQEIETMRIPGREDLVEMAVIRNPVPLVVKYKIWDETSEGFRERSTRLNSLLKERQGVIHFSDERYYYFGTVSVNDIPEEETNTMIGTITFSRTDPNKYTNKKTALFGEGVAKVYNQGSADTYPVFRAMVNEPITHVQLFTDADYFQAGNPAGFESVIIEREERLLHDSMASLVGWSELGLDVDGGVVSGAFSTNGYSVSADTFGPVVSTWRGPALKKSIPEAPVTDFKVRTSVIFRNPTSSHRGRIEFYLLDDQSRDIGKLAMKRTGAGTFGTGVEARAGGGSDFNYFVSDYRGKNGIEWRDFEGVLEISRIGNVWEVYVAKVDPVTKEHYARYRKPYTDSQLKYISDLSQIQIHIAQAGTAEPSSMFIGDVKVFRINEQGEEEVGIIAVAGDEVVIDMQKKKIYINGEQRPDLKAFGGNYFKLDSGETAVALDPAESLDASIEWREAFR